MDQVGQPLVIWNYFVADATGKLTPHRVSKSRPDGVAVVILYSPA